MALAADQVHQDARERRVVLDGEDHRFTGCNRMAVIGNPVDQRCGGRAHRRRRKPLLDGDRRRHRADRSRPQRQHQRETTALVLFAVHHQLATQQLGQATCDGQAQSTATVVAAGAGIHLLECFENGFQALFRNADAGIAYRQCQVLLIGGGTHAGKQRGIGHRQVQRHLAFAGELEGVAEQVVEHLLQLGTVGDQRFGHRRIHDDGELQAAFHRHVAEMAGDFAGQCFHPHFLAVHVHLAGFDLGQVQDVVDQAQQVGAGIMDDRCRFHFLRIQMAALVLGQFLGQDQQAVERRAQLVRHVGQEVSLVLAGTRQLLRLELGFALQHLQHILLLVEHFGLLPQLLVGGLQLLGLHAQFFFRRRQALCVFFQLHGLALKLFVGRAQFFLLRLQGHLRPLQLLGLGAGMVEQQLGFVGAADVVQPQRGRCQYAVDESFLAGAEMAEAAELQHAQQAVLQQQRHRDQRVGLRFAQGRMHAEEFIRHLLHADAGALQRGLADQAIAQSIPQAQVLAPLEAVTTLQPQFLFLFVINEEHTDGRTDARRNLRNQRLCVIVRRLHGLQRRTYLADAELDPVGVARGQRVLAEHIQCAGDGADFITALQSVDFHVQVIVGQARHLFGEAIDRLHHHPRDHPQRADDDQEARHQQHQRDGVGAPDPLAHAAALFQQHCQFRVVDAVERVGQRVAPAGTADPFQPLRRCHLFGRSLHAAQRVHHLGIPGGGLRLRPSQAFNLAAVTCGNGGLQGSIAAVALLLQRHDLGLTLAQQMIADGDLLQTHGLDGHLHLPDHFDLLAFLPACCIILSGGAVADHAGGQETQEHQAKCDQHLAQQRNVVDPATFVLRHAGAPSGCLQACPIRRAALAPKR
ncbi:hypothetical protein D3C81_767810 [compost metagenome]